MDKRKSYMIQYAIILLLAVAIAGILLYMGYRSNMNVDMTFAPDYTITDNPLMGFAPDASNSELCENANLVFINITFKDWEPSEGAFDIEGIERKYDIARWKEENKHAVIRFVCDVPGTFRHMDIPDWLADKGIGGEYYDTSMGMGFCPDYSDPVFMKYHDSALKALAEYCNKDHFVSFVELGSLGHWGEWHAQGNSGRNLMPDPEICNTYAQLYADNFANARLLTRRNYDFAVSSDIGVYNDMVGDPDQTGEWLDWMEKGAIQETSGKDLVLEKVSDIGLRAPVGGEFASSFTMEEMLGDKMGDTLRDISESRMTFIGPKVPDFNDEKLAVAADSVVRRTGYRIYPSRLKTQYNFTNNVINVEVSFRNAGNAGFFFDWPVTLYVFDKNKKQIFWQGLGTDLRDLSADEDVTSYAQIPYSDEIRDEYYIGIGITDYDKKDSVRLAIDSDSEIEFVGDIQLIYHYVRE